MLEQKIQKNKGFSLLELLIYISILSILVVVISNTFISLSRGNGQSQARSEVNNSIRFATELLRQDLKNASAVATPSLGTPSSTISLTRSIADVPTTIVYDISAGILRRKEGAASPSNITSSNISVSAPTFTRIENTNPVFSTTNVTIKINMTFNYNSTSPDWTYSSSLQTAVDLY